jgi:hemerythrin-like domain-containing protein
MAQVRRSKTATQSARKKSKTPATLEKTLARAASAAGQVVGTSVAAGRAVANSGAARAVGTTVAAVAARVRPAGPHDPIEMLERDHRRLEELLEKGEKTTDRGGKTRAAVLQQLTSALVVHELIEENVLYPALKPHRDAREVVLEGYQEHHVADVLVRELERLPTDDERWGATFKVLKENIEHHIEEEEGDMFPTARSVLDREQLESIGLRMEALKAERRKSRR